MTVARGRSGKINSRRKNCKSVLIISYFFPPLGGPAALRPLKFAKYLPDYQGSPIILSVRNPDWYYAYNPGLLHELPESVRIERAFMFRSAWLYRLLNPLRNPTLERSLRKYVFHPDDHFGWIPCACLKARRLIHRYSVKAIFSTSRPFSCHLIAYQAKKGTGLPWIADFQDEWIENPDLELPTAFHRRMHYSLERRVVQNADKVTAMTPTFCRLLSKHLPHKDKFVTLTGGYDPEDFEDADTPGNLNRQHDRFAIVFTGMFYRSFRPDTLLKSINQLIKEGRIPADKIRVYFVGANRPKDIDFEDSYKVCEFTGHLPHREAVRYMCDASVLLLLLSEERGRGVIPSKIFEYIAAGKPVLALVPPSGDAATIIRETNTGIVVDFRDVREIKESVFKLYNKWDRGTLSFQQDTKAIAHFDLKNLTGNLAKILDEIICKPA